MSEARVLLAPTAGLCAVAFLASASEPIRGWADAVMPWLLGGAGLVLVAAGALSEWWRQRRQVRGTRRARRKRAPQ